MTAFTITTFLFHLYVGSVCMCTLSFHTNMWGPLHVSHCLLFSIMNEQLVRAYYWVTILLLWPLGKFESSLMSSFAVLKFSLLMILEVLKKFLYFKDELEYSWTLVQSIMWSWVLQFFISLWKVLPHKCLIFSFFFIFLSLVRLCVDWCLFFLLHTQLFFLLHLSFLCLFLGVEEVCFLLIDSTVYFFLWEFKFCCWIFSFSKLLPKKTLLPLTAAPSSAVPSLYFTKSLYSQSSVSHRPRFLKYREYTVNLIISPECTSFSYFHVF